MKGKSIKAPKFGSFAHEPTPMKNYSAPFVFAIGTQHEEDIDSARSTSASQASCTSQTSSISNSKETFDKQQRRSRKRDTHELKISFKHELAKLGPTLKVILDKNPAKNGQTPYPSPNCTISDDKGLPFQRRARSLSPIRESLNLGIKKDHLLFAVNSPVAPTQHFKSRKVFDDFMNISRHSYSSEDDDDLKYAKESYCRMLEDAPKPGQLKLDLDDTDEELEKLLQVRDFSQP